jgi:hypothetical protein
VSQKDNSRDLAELALLRTLLKEEGETELLSRIASCQQPLVLKCCSCGARKQVAQRCKRRWCPCCAKQLASQRASELEYITARMQWPLFVTLTMRNESEITVSVIRKLRRAFGKLRHRKLWSTRTRGGVACVELTNIGNGWHPHVHAVIDCRWLAWKTHEPLHRASREEKLEAFKSAAAELSTVWAKILGQETASVKVKRASAREIAKEVTKYTVKNEDLVMCEGRIGDMIRALDGTRLMTSFGTAHGSKVKDVRAEAKKMRLAELRDWRESMAELDCCPAADLMLESMADSPNVQRKIQERRRQGADLRALAEARLLP